MNYQQRLEKNVDEKNVADDENVDGISANEIDGLEHFIKNYSVVQYSIRNRVIEGVMGQRTKLYATLYDKKTGHYLLVTLPLKLNDPI